ncbi:hypothetical protein C8F04DRAFT_974121 [Mycena alexandri]|uniref:Uncharacterized protein n=1 Tax=Mycena alexandri TaxID=1745969 RepID=A0AAD6WPM7_9AGAR|nr:hypothetical protein C8F04DRAFT_974121 [Mycena alexandri]
MGPNRAPSTFTGTSAILRHSNLKIGPGETRFSFTQFTPTGIFRWVYNDFRTDKDINTAKFTTSAERERWKQDRARRWQDGIRMYRRLGRPRTVNTPRTRYVDLPYLHHALIMRRLHPYPRRLYLKFTIAI